MGLHADTIGEKAILDSVNIRMKDCNIVDIDKYYQKLTRHSDELKELIEEVVVPETWFFRDSKPFKQLIKFADEEWGAKTSNKPLRILSLPCATGEEPYSIAMTMLDAGFMPSQVEIDALDISKRNIRRCKEAAYRPHSFRGVENATRDKFFHPNNDKYEPVIIINSMVNFSQASILDPGLLFSKISLGGLAKVQLKLPILEDNSLLTVQVDTSYPETPKLLSVYTLNTGCIP